MNPRMTKKKPLVRDTKEHVLHYLKGYLGSAFESARIYTVCADGRIFANGIPFAMYRYFDGVEKPIFSFVDRYIEDRLEDAANRFQRLPFDFSISTIGALEVSIAGYANVAKAREIVINELRLMPIGAKSRMRIVCDDPTLVSIEFWDTTHAQEWLDYLNAKIEPSSVQEIDEVREYPAAWEGLTVYYTQGSDTFAVDVKVKSDVRVLGTVEIRNDRLSIFRYDNDGAIAFDKRTAGVPKKLLAK